MPLVLALYGGQKVSPECL